MMTMSYFKDRYSREGKDPAECAIALSQNGCDIVGINCGRGPNQMLPLVKEMRDAIDGYVAIQATAYATTDEVPFCGGLPGFPDGMEPYQVDRFVMADYAQRAKDMGINYIGGCCGSVAVHIREMARVLGKPVQERKAWSADYASPMSATEEWRDYRLESGERL